METLLDIPTFKKETLLDEIVSNRALKQQHSVRQGEVLQRSVCGSATVFEWQAWRLVKWRVGITDDDGNM